MQTSTVFEPPFRQREWNTVRRKQDAHRDAADDDGAGHVSEVEGDGIRNPDKAASAKTSPRPGSNLRRSSYSTHQPSEHANVKYQHFATLNAALYKCLQEQKYGQASRIYGMLLRFSPPGADPAGSHVDLRKQNLWGVGAEILLQRARPDHSDNQPDASSISTEKGFQDAKTFYERLILQYPMKKSHPSVIDPKRIDGASASKDLSPNSVSALQFYPILFSLWIFQVQSRVQERAKNVAELQATYQYHQEDAEAENDEMHAANAANIRPIIERMGEVVRVPPYDHDPELTRMHGELLLWLAGTLDQLRARSQDSTALRTDAAQLLAKAEQLGST